MRLTISREEIAERIKEDIYRWNSQQWMWPAPRDYIGRAIGRTLLCSEEVDRLLDKYRKCWPRDPESPWGALKRPHAHDVPPIYDGGHWKRQWWLLRDWVIPTKNARAVARIHRRCGICGQRIGHYCQSSWLGDPEAQNIILNRHFTKPVWETPLKERLNRTPWPDMRAYASYSKDYRAEYGEAPEGVCSATCEATRFSRWYGRKQQRYRQLVKQENRERIEKQWIRIAKQKLKEAHLYLNNPKVWQ